MKYRIKETFYREEKTEKIKSEFYIEYSKLNWRGKEFWEERKEIKAYGYDSIYFVRIKYKTLEEAKMVIKNLRKELPEDKIYE